MFFVTCYIIKVYIRRITYHLNLINTTMNVRNIYGWFSLALFVCAIFFVGCKDQENEVVNKIDPIAALNLNLKKGSLTWDNDVMRFSDRETFDEFVNLVANNEELKSKLRLTFGKQLLVNSNNETLINIVGTGYPYALNSKGQCIVNDDYMVYQADNVKYLTNIKNTEIVEDLKKGIVQSSPLIRKETYGYSGSSSANAKLLKKDDLDSHNQYEFNQVSPCCGARKYVHELKSFTDGGVNKLELKIKLEFKKTNGKWAIAGEQRHIVYNFNFSGIFATKFNGDVPINGNRNADIIGTDQVLLLVQNNFDALGTDSSTPWDITVTGYIQQNVVGDANYNLWRNEGTLF